MCTLPVPLARVWPACFCTECERVCAYLFSDIQTKQIVALKPARERKQEAARAATNVHNEGTPGVGKLLRPILRRQLHLQLLPEGVSMLPAPHPFHLHVVHIAVQLADYEDVRRWRLHQAALTVHWCRLRHQGGGVPVWLPHSVPIQASDPYAPLEVSCLCVITVQPVV